MFSWALLKVLDSEFVIFSVSNNIIKTVSPCILSTGSLDNRVRFVCRLSVRFVDGLVKAEDCG